MEIFIITDLEGVAGVLNADDYIEPDCRYYERARQLTTLEVNAAIEGALDAGATGFLVLDGHGAGAIDPELLHPQARLLAGRPLRYPFELDETFGAAFMIGQHAKANTDGGHLCHSHSFDVQEVTINGRPVGEVGCNVLMASYFGVKTVLLAGDRAAGAEFLELVPGAEVAAVKEGVRRGSCSGLTAREAKQFNGAAIHLAPVAARELIRKAAARAVRRVNDIPLFWLDPPYELVSLERPTEQGGSMLCRRAEAGDLLALLNGPREVAGWRVGGH
jgi:D-amino peptidase